MHALIASLLHCGGPVSQYCQSIPDRHSQLPLPASRTGLKVPGVARIQPVSARPCQSTSYVGEFEQHQLFWYVVMVSLSSTGTLLEYHPYKTQTRKLPLTVGLPDSSDCSSTTLLSRARCAALRAPCQAAPGPPT